MKTHYIYIKSYFIAALMFLSISFSSCKKDDSKTNGGNNDEKIEYKIHFKHLFAGNPIVYDTMIYEDAAGNKMDVQKIRYFLSKISLVAEDNSITEISDAVYIDSREPETLTFSSKKNIANGKYKGVQFIFGLDESMNISGRFMNFPEVAMEWPEPMGGGYHYMQFEGSFTGKSGLKNYAIHLGRINQTENYFKVEIPYSLTINKTPLEININMNVEKWFDSPNPIDLDTMPSMIMMNQDYQTKFKQNGAHVFTID